MSFPSAHRFVPALMLLASVGLASCELLGDTSLPDYEAIADISYVRHVQVLLEDRCAVCHNGSGAELDLRTWDGLLEGSSVGGALVPFDAGRSRMVRMLSTRQGAAHPSELGAEVIPEIEVDFLRRWIDAGARDDNGVVPYSGSADQVLVSVAEPPLVVVVDPTYMVVARIIDFEQLGFSAASNPSALASSGNGKAWFVSLEGEDSVLRFDADHALTGLAEVPEPGGLASSGNGGWLVVGRTLSQTARPIHTVETTDMRVRPVEMVFPETVAAAIRPHGDYGFTVSESADQIAVFPVEGGPTTYFGIFGPRHRVTQLLTSADGTTMVAVGSASGEATLFDISSPTQIEQTGAVALGSGLRGVDLSANGTLALITEVGGVHTAAMESGASVRHVADVADAVGVTHAGERILVARGNESRTYHRTQRFTDLPAPGVVVVIDPVTGVVLREIEIEAAPTAMTRLSSTIPTN
jgi:SpoU rRNA methylase family enzyme